MSDKKHGLILAVCLFLLAVASCAAVFFAVRLRSSHYEGAAVSTELALIDTYIRTGEPKTALDMLSRLEQRTYDVMDKVGIYKRYMTLGEYTKAENCLKKALRHNKDSKELVALYSNLLLRQNRVKAALKSSKTLLGTEYGSIHAEAVFRDANVFEKSVDSYFGKGFFSFFKHEKTKSDEITKTDKKAFFMDERFIPFYRDAYIGSKLPEWLMNAACIYMSKGQYVAASALCPADMVAFKDSLFWGIVLYDSGLYAESLRALLCADKFEDARDIASAIELRALESDDYYILGDDESAQVMRQNILQVSSPYMKAYMDDNVPVLKRVLPLLFMNTALYSRETGNPIDEYNKLFELVSYYPTYEPGLAAYAQYAMDSLSRPKEGFIDQQIREAGLKTTDMEKRDEIPVVSLDDVILKIDVALAESSTPALLVLKQIVSSFKKRDAERNEKAAVVWGLLEENQISPSMYPPEIMRYAVAVLVNNGDEQNAEKLFYDYIKAVFEQNLSDTAVRTANPADYPEKLRLWEAEDAAYFSVRSENYDDAVKLYNYIISTYSSRKPVFNTSGQNSVVTNAYINLANIYSGYNRSAQALDYLNKASGRLSDERAKSEVLYRSGSESARLGKTKDAISSLQYALKLNPSHNKARLLLREIQ